MLSDWMTYWWGWDVIEHWMLTGEFVWKLPVLGVWQRWRDPAGKPPCDWWGINYYSRGIFSWYLCPSCRHQEVMTDMYYPIYPEGMYEAIKRCASGRGGGCDGVSRSQARADIVNVSFASFP